MPYGFFSAGGKMGKAVLNNDWSKHDLGIIDQWPQSLRSALGICLHSPFPMAVYWGKEMYTLYNDAWTPVLGDKHPHALGLPARDVWHDIWDVIGPNMEEVMRTGQGNIAESTLLPMYRRGYTEEAYFDYTINPIYGEDNKVDGLLIIASEVTSRLLANRRSTVLHELSESTLTAESAEAACIIAANTLSDAPYDIPFARMYLLSEDKTYIRLVADTSIDDTDRLHIIDLSDNRRILPYADVIRNRKAQVVYNVDTNYSLGRSIWSEPPRHVAVIPLVRPTDNAVYGLLVVGISPRLFYDQAYSEFLRDVGEKISFSIGNAVDLHRRITLEEREKRTQGQLKAALSSGLIGVWSWDILGDVVTTDDNMADMFGVNHSRAKAGLPIEEFISIIHPEDQKRVRKKIEKTLSGLSWFEDEYRVMHEDGSIGWVLVRGNIEVNKLGKPIRFPGVVVDITERKKIEEDLANSQQIFKALFNSSILGMAVASLDGTIHDANKAFLHMFGYTSKDLAKGMHSDLVTPSGSSSVTKHIYTTLKQRGEVEPVNKQYVRKDGSIMPALVGAVVMPGSEDKFISFILDVSEQTHLRELNKAKDEFISIASHQLRTPATGVKQYLGMLLEGFAGDLSDKQNELLAIAYASNERQLVIVNDLLRVAQADAKEIRLTKESIDLVSLLRDVLNEQSVKFKEKEQSIEFNYSKPKVMAMVDPFYLRMALENIVDNAHKYTPMNKTVSVSLQTSRGNVTVSITDEGVGIKRVDQSKLFKKFSRIDNPLSMTAGGTGLGLYWVKKIIDLHHGSIAVNSRIKKGTTFAITVPSGITRSSKGR